MAECLTLIQIDSPRIRQRSEPYPSRTPNRSDSGLFATASTNDAVSSELELAWSLTYDRSPDPSDAWDHAIEAVEELLIPIVVGAKSKATLGDVAGELKANPSRYSFDLQSSGVLDAGQTLEALVRLIWPNPDRHGGGPQRPLSQAESELVTQSAVYIVALCRGRLTRS